VRLIGLWLSIALTLTHAPNERAMGMLRDWISAVQEHTVGEPDAALARIGTWTYDDLEMMRAYVEALADAPIKEDRDRARRRTQINDQDMIEIAELRRTAVPRDVTTFLKRAALFHTDSVLLGTAPVIEVAPPIPRGQKPRWARETTERRVNVRSRDGRLEGFQLSNLHWAFAMDLLEALPSAPHRDPIVALWFRAVGAHFARERNYADSMPHFARGRRLAPDAAEILFGEACLQESLGAPRQQEYVRITTLPNGSQFQGVESAQAHFRRAESLLRRALVADPGLVEARLRLGRVLAAQARHADALTELQQVSARTTDARLAYYAHLFMGDSALALDRLPAARVCYETAISIYSLTQAARIGLAAALRASGDRSAALAAVLPTLNEPADSRDETDDPWWNYYDGDAANLTALMERLRAPFRGPAP
jgi:tetratricopeptide (TPR) repeat protein